MNYREAIYRRYAEKFQASGYQRADLVAHWTRAYRWYFRRWLPTAPDAAIVDVGCGGGQMLQVMKNLGYTALQGVDASEQQVQRARTAGLDVRHGNATDALRESPARRDLILAIDMVEHLHKGEAMEFLEAAHAALRPGGRLILQMPNPDARAGMRVRYGDLTHEIAFGPEAAGLETEEVSRADAITLSKDWFRIASCPAFTTSAVAISPNCRCLAIRWAMTSWLSVPRPTRRSCNSSKSGGVRKIKTPSGTFCLTWRAP